MRTEPSSHLFGNQRGKTISKEDLPKVQPTGPLTIRTLTDESDDEDDDFSACVSDLDGCEGLSEESSSEDDEENENESKHGSVDEHGSDVDMEDRGDEDGELDPAKHPLLRPGAMPPMSLKKFDNKVRMDRGSWLERASHSLNIDHLVLHEPPFSPITANGAER